MFHLYQSNKIEALLAQLVKLLLQQECSPLKSQTVVVENPGLAHWLKMQMANSLGIAANIEFPMPSRFFWQVQRTVQPELDDESVFSKDTLTWLVLECLNNEEMINRPSFELLRSYLTVTSSEDGQVETSEQQQAVKLYQLASNIADLYDQYLVFRPDWIKAWQDKDFRMGDEPLDDQLWQGQLWIELIELAKQKGLSVNHRASMLQDFMHVLKDGDNKASLPNDVIFFGFSTLPKHQIETLSLLSQHMDVHVLTPNPSMHYWGDVMNETVQAKLRMRNKSVELADAGNDLLASLGTMGKDFQQMLLDIEHIQEQPMFYESEGDSLLSTIQNQILTLQQAKDLKTPIAEADKSIQVVGCHSAMREIEVLHDHLLNLFSNTQVEPQEIVVMIPDVACYAPYIDAVFNSSKIRIPYSISDRPVQAEHPLLAAFIAILELPKGRFNFSDVMSLLEVPAIYRAYGISEHQLPRLKTWLSEAGIRWGYDSEHRSKQGLPNWDQNTWVYGFKRLLMGYAVSSNHLISGISPIQNVEGLDASLLGPVIQFVDHLHDFIALSECSSHANVWSEKLHLFINQVFDITDTEQIVIEHVYQVLESWVQSTQSVSFDGELSFSVVVEGIKQRLQKAGGSQHFMVGKVNFCTLLPMRSIPFKVVAVLGLNDQDYPRSVTPNSLDLMRFKRRIGDRSRRDEDRYLFLEAILSARDSLWLSYKSRDQKEDKPMTPSVVLAELLDYLQEGFEYPDGQMPLDKLFVQHPLQPFNEQYYAKSSPLFSFNKDWLAAHNSNLARNESLTKPLDIEGSVDKNSGQVAYQSHHGQENQDKPEILLEDLIQFYQNPSKYYLNQNLNISLSLWAESQENEEPFDLDGLALFKLKERTLENAKRQILNSQKDDYQETSNISINQVSISSGQLAYGEIGDRQWQALQSSVSPLLDQCELHMVNPISSPIEINYVYRSLFSESAKDNGLKSIATSLLGWVSAIFDETLVYAIPSNLKSKHVIKLLIEHAALCVMGRQYSAKLICQNAIVNIQPMAKSDAVEWLKPLIEYFLLAKQHAIPLLPETAWELSRPAKKGGREYNNSKHAFDAFNGVAGDFGKAGEKEDLHVIRCLGDLTDIPEETLAMAESIYAPWIDLMEITGNE